MVGESKNHVTAADTASRNQLAALWVKSRHQSHKRV
jgi:hypothetical protein